MEKCKALAAVMVAAGLMSAAAAKAEDESPWMVRARAVHLGFSNGQADGLQGNIQAQDRTIPEVDINYFFSKNIAAELVLSYPQVIDVNAGGAKIGSVKALPPTLLAQYHFTDMGAFQPYVGAGVNYTFFFDRNNLAGGAASVDSHSLGLAAQVGFDYLLDKHWSLNVDVKYVKMDTDVTVNGAKVGRLDLNPTLVGLGVGYRF